MTAFYLQRKQKSIQTEESPTLAPIPLKDAFSLMRKIPSAPTDEICIGWDYRPLVAEIFENNPDMNFFIHEDTVALEVRERNPKTGGTFVKAIIYGNEKNALLLLNAIRGRNMNVRLFFCLVPKTLEPTIERTDFMHACTVWTGKKNIVVLFKKYL